MSKPIPKSLHTVTAIVQVARYYRATNSGITHEYAVFAAIAILGYSVEKDQDPYGLASKATAILNQTR